MASGNISVSQSSISSCPESSRIHLMACEIEHDGEAQVASYFDTSVREEEANSGVQNSVKGMSLPDLCLGVLGRSAYMPTLPGYPGVSQIRHRSLALPYESPNLPDKIIF